MKELEARLRLAEAMSDLVRVHMNFDTDRARTWMFTENPLLGNCAPQHLILIGRSHKVLAFIEAAISENKPE